MYLFSCTIFKLKIFTCFKSYTSFKKNITCTKRRGVPPHLKTKTERHRKSDKNKEHGGNRQQDGAEAKSVATGGVRWGVRWWRRSRAVWFATKKISCEKITWNLPMVTRNWSSWYRGLSNPSGQRHLNSFSFIESPVYLHCFAMAVRKQSCKQMS